MKILRKRPGEAWDTLDIPNTLKALQTEVGGYIETVTLATDAVIICNEEGMLMDLPLQEAVGRHWFGTILIIGVDGGEFCDVPECAVRMAEEGRL